MTLLSPAPAPDIHAQAGVAVLADRCLSSGSKSGNDDDSAKAVCSRREMGGSRPAGHAVPGTGNCIFSYLHPSSLALPPPL